VVAKKILRIAQDDSAKKSKLFVHTTSDRWNIHEWNRIVPCHAAKQHNAARHSNCLYKHTVILPLSAPKNLSALDTLVIRGYTMKVQEINLFSQTIRRQGKFFMSDYPNANDFSQAQQPGKPEKRRRIRPFRLAIFLFFVAAVIIGITALVLMLAGPRKAATGTEQKKAVFGVSSIVVEGSDHYSDKAIVEKSGLYIGQSVLSVNKKSAVMNIQADFPYVQSVAVDSPSFGSLRIRIVEEIPIAVVGSGSGEGPWIIVSETNKWLESVSADAAAASGYLQVRTNKTGEGNAILPEREILALHEIITACAASELTDIRGIDMTNMTDIRLNWRDQIEILLGNDSVLQAEIPIVAQILHEVLKNNGNDKRGRLDASTFSDAIHDNNRAIFTPQSELDSHVAG